MKPYGNGIMTAYGRYGPGYMMALGSTSARLLNLRNLVILENLFLDITLPQKIFGPPNIGSQLQYWATRGNLTTPIVMVSAK